ncbi:GGDEF domain-containing protein [Aliikangiella marina]|uniref:diguanylate cyclase n=1 Tax=Aliikangiella marina TaxID=1712262 RepID=A0A545T170_9GAMM|nr:GGDEF domain-containing protein [Aliikangiella marina]TQV70967.1 GGDEF domain-containing protein [Aliikangiella marina]
MNKVILRSIQAALFAAGAPLGWLFIQFLKGVDLAQEILNNWDLYTYMLFGTMTVFVLFAIYVARKETHMTQIASRDALTNIYNLRYFIERMQQETDRARRYETPVSLIYFDLDHFKKVNDTYGHPVGDKVLIEVAKTVKDLVRSYDIFARVGGEEFAILQPTCGIEDSKKSAEMIRDAIENLTIQINDGKTVQVTLSCGVTEWVVGEDVDAFYKRADGFLYQAKQTGRNKVVSG